MSDEVLGALISAAASIAIALINKKSESSKAEGPSSRREASSMPTSPISRRFSAVPGPLASRAWYVFGGVLMVWMALSPALVHHDFAGTNFLLIPPLVILIALIVPVQPLKAAWMSMALFAANFVLGPLSNRIKGSPYDRSILGAGDPGEAGKLEFVLMIAAVTAAVTAGICFLRLKYRHPSIPTPAAQMTGTLSAELEKLAHLREQGALSENEFQRAKEKLLGTAGRIGESG